MGVAIALILGYITIVVAVCFFLIAKATTVLSRAVDERIAREKAAIAAAIDDRIRDFVMPAADGQPSQLADVIQAAGKILAQEISLSFNAKMAGTVSAISRTIDDVEGEVITQELSNIHPAAGLLMGFSPKLKSKLARLAKSPAGQQIMQQLAAAGRNKNNGHSSPAGGNENNSSMGL